MTTEELRLPVEITADELIRPTRGASVVTIVGNGTPGATLIARRLAGRRGGAIRAPHHTVSTLGLVSELAVAAGGTLILDEINEFRRESLRAMLSTWSMMHAEIRPVLVLTTRDGANRHADLFEKGGLSLAKVIHAKVQL